MVTKALLYTVVLAVWFAGPFVQGCFSNRLNNNNNLTQKAKNNLKQKDKNNLSQKDRISVKGPWMVDGYGRVRIFHGFNAVQKGVPWYSDKLTESYLKHYEDWGFNVVRMGAMWSGVQPREGSTNNTYLDVVKDTVQRAGRHGIYALLDMHQDVISTKFDAYDGVPRWVIDKMSPPTHPYPWPLTKLSQWADGYLTEAVGNAFQSLYNNVAGTRDDMATFWQIVAGNFKSFYNVIGYELINEPWAGDIYKHPGLLLPGNAGHMNLEPLYDILNAAIRKVDNTTIIFYEPVTWGMVFPGNGTLGNGFKSVPGGPAFVNRSVMSWHYYCWILAIDDSKPYGGLTRTVCDNLLGPKVFDTVRTDIQRTGGASFLTEFGLCDPNNSPGEAQTIECEFVLNMADRNLQSWAYWDSQFFNETTGAVLDDVVRHFARVYASATAGTPLTMAFDIKTRKFTYTYQPDVSVSAPTEIIVPPLQYPSGFVVKVSPGYDWHYDKKTHIVQVTPSKARTNISLSEVKVWIAPK